MVNKDEYGWLCDDMEGKKEKILFRDRVEYRVSGKLHNPVGPAVINTYDPLTMISPDEDNYKEYYINDVKMNEEEWSLYNREHKLKRLKKKTKEKKEVS